MVSVDDEMSVPSISTAQFLTLPEIQISELNDFF